MKFLILVQSYPSNENIYQLMYVHTRLKEFVRKGHTVNVVSFAALNNYVFDGINVYAEKNIKDISSFDIVISHAPNLRNHLRFIYKNYSFIKKLVFVIHGHEVLQKSKYYPKPYKYLRGKFYLLKFITNYLYDKFKLFILKNIILKLFKNNRLKIIFVSEWMRNAFLENIRINKELLKENSAVIPNPIGKDFLEKKYKLDNKDIRADFISIRPFDNPKYAVDIFIEIARQNPEKSFHIFGKGDFFKYYDKPDNVKIFNKFILNTEIPDLLTHYRAAIMLTRLDAQGVMMCEMAEFGIPIIVSDIPICREMLKEFSNIFFINNISPVMIADEILNSTNMEHYGNIKKFDAEHTIYEEIKYIEQFANKRD